MMKKSFLKENIFVRKKKKRTLGNVNILWSVSPILDTGEIGIRNTAFFLQY